MRAGESLFGLALSRKGAGEAEPAVEPDRSAVELSGSRVMARSLDDESNLAPD